MNCFGSCGDNTYLWILIILLIISCCGGSSLLDLFNNSDNGCYWAFLIAVLYCLWKKGAFANILGGNCNCGCK